METVRVMLFGSLSQAKEEKPGRPLEIPVNGPVQVGRLLEGLDLGPDKVQMFMVNHRAAAPDQLVGPGDRLAVFPKEYVIFADWACFRQ
ncbi:MAG: hypothetical protein AB1896_03285 [Thermodesulfobacteriota bacterium]